VIGLADTSAWTAKHRAESVERDFDAWVIDGEIAICDVVRFELLRTAQDLEHFAAMNENLEALRSASIGPRVWRRALDVFELFARQGPLHHRRVRWPDLLVAAAAERVEVPVLHYDSHFELIAEVTGQPVRAIAPLGSL
jgi:predicted nucleic acid-binding protein